jgi:hypothetical protein
MLQGGNKAAHAHAKQVKVSVQKDVALAFKAACARANVSVASVLSRYMADYAGSKHQARPDAPMDYSTKRRRRAAMRSILRQLELIMEHDERSRDNLPENLHGSMAYENADEAIAAVEEALEILSSY